MKSKPAASVDQYLAEVPKEDRIALEKLRKAIKAAAPEAEEMISYRMPAYKYHGPLVFFAAFQNHLSLFVGKLIPVALKKELAGYVTKAGTIHFTAQKPLPSSLVKKIVKARMKENEARAKKKQKK